MDKKQTKKDRPKNKKIDGDAQGFTLDIDRFYASRKEEEVASFEECVDAKIQQLEEYTKKSKEKLIIATSYSNINQNKFR